MSNPEFIRKNPEKIQLLKPVEDISSFIAPGYADAVMNSFEENGLLIYKDKDIMVTKEKKSANGIPVVWYHAFDTINGLPHYGLATLEQTPHLIISATTFEYKYSHIPELMEKPIVTSTYTNVIPVLKIKQIYKSELDLTDIALYKGRSTNVYSDKKILDDESCKPIANVIAKQFALLPGEEHIVPIK